MCLYHFIRLFSSAVLIIENGLIAIIHLLSSMIVKQVFIFMFIPFCTCVIIVSERERERSSSAIIICTLIHVF